MRSKIQFKKNTYATAFNHKLHTGNDSTCSHRANSDSCRYPYRHIHTLSAECCVYGIVRQLERIPKVEAHILAKVLCQLLTTEVWKLKWD